MFDRYLVGIFALALAFPVALCAGDITGLYSGRAEVADRSAEELNRGASAALSEVLIKLTGNRRSAIAKPGSSLLKRASKLLLQYTYAAPGAGGALVLQAEFDEVALASELQDRQVAIWGKERPDSVVWLIVDSDDQRQLVSGDEPGLFGEAALRAAERRGIPVLLPLMDIDESQQLQHAADWPGLATTAVALSGRYATPATLIGYLRRSGPSIWEVDWLTQIGSDKRSWREQGDLVNLMVEEGFDDFADALAARYADQQVLASAERLALSIFGVRSAEDYARLANYLEGLDSVSDLFVDGISNDRVAVRFSARGGRSALAESISFGRVLTPRAGQIDSYDMNH